MRSPILYFLIIALLGPASSLADVPDFAYTGLAGVELTGLVWSGGGTPESFLCATSAAGFYRLDGDQWEAYVEPGVPGREVTAVNQHPGNTDRYITGRVDESGHGYLELTYTNGQPNEIVYESLSGSFQAIELSAISENYESWAITRAGDQPSELLHSVDGGENWELVTGHGMSDLTGIVINYYTPGEVIIVAGDAGVTRTWDGGLSWEAYSSGLPVGAVHSMGDSGPPVGIPDKEKSGYYPLYAATDEGLYWSTFPSGWQRVFSEPSRNSSTGALGLFYTTMVLTQDDRLFFGYTRASAPWSWADWSSYWTAMEIVGVNNRFGAMVATANKGVFRAIRPLSDVPDASAHLKLTAAPNPFNPGTVLYYDVPVSGHGTLNVYDVAGKLVAGLLAEPMSAGTHSLSWRPKELPSGVYLVRLSVNGLVTNKRVVLLK